MRWIRAFLALLLLVTSGCSLPTMAKAVEVRDPRAYPDPDAPTERMVAALALSSPERSALLVGVRPVDGPIRAQLQTWAFERGRPLTKAVDDVKIPRNLEVVLQPDGIHVVLTGFKEPPKVGASLSLILEFGDGSEKRVRFPILTPPVPTRSNR